MDNKSDEQLLVIQAIMAVMHVLLMHEEVMHVYVMHVGEHA